MIEGILKKIVRYSLYLFLLSIFLFIIFCHTATFLIITSPLIIFLSLILIVRWAFFEDSFSDICKEIKGMFHV
jgi:hypothetical protein